MTDITRSLAQLTDADLMREVKRLAGYERDATARLVAHLAELDVRRLYLGAGFPSLFAYCTGALGLTEGEAYNRIEVARTSQRFPAVLPLLQDGRLNLTSVRLLAPHLSTENSNDMLSLASGQSCREVEKRLAGRFPQRPVPTSIRKLPERTAALALDAPPTEPDIVASRLLPSAPPAPPPPTRRAVVAPLTEDQYKITFTARAETCRKLKLAQDLLRHQIPDGSPAEIFDRALSLLLDDISRKKVASAHRPLPRDGSRPGSRHIPAHVKRGVWLRDGGRCAFRARDGRRCGEHGFLEFHHVVPYAMGGDVSADNVALRCRPHNAYEAELAFGPTGHKWGTSSRNESRRSDSTAPDSTAPVEDK
jgi:5-methylcytosine-specific restriction endonuclease McrA